MVSRPNSSFFGDVMETLEKVAAMGRLGANEHYRSQGVVLAGIYTDTDYFLMSNYLFQVVIQMRQMELSKLTPRQYAVQHYRIWSFESAETALMLQSFYNYRGWPFVNDLQQLPLSAYAGSLGGPNFLIKLTGWHYPTLNDVFDNYVEYNCWNLSQAVREDSVIYEYLLALSPELPEVREILEFNSVLAQERKGSYCAERLESFRFLSPSFKKLFTAFFLLSVSRSLEFTHAQQPTEKQMESIVLKKEDYVRIDWCDVIIHYGLIF